MGPCPYSHMNLWSCGVVRLHDNLKSLCLHYHSTYDHQTWQAGELPWGTSTHNVTSLFGHARSPDKLEPLYLYYKNITKTLQDGDLLWQPFTLKSNDHTTTWFCEITWQTKIIIVLLPQCVWSQKLTGYDDIPWVTSTHKVTWSYNYVVL